MNVYLTALGCRLNEAEISSWASDFTLNGHRIVSNASDADLMVLNTCAVTQEATRKSRQNVKRLHRENPSAKLVVSGCYVSLEQQEAAELLGVDLVVNNNDKDRLVQISNEFLSLHTMPEMANAPSEASLFTRNRQRAFIKIQDGCRYRCTFCIVTVARGEERSRSLTDIINEVNQYTQQGIKEIVLTGVHVGGYGSDIDSDLHTLVKVLLADTDIERIRFASVEPWDIPEDFFSLFKSKRLMPHMHLPIQSGSDPILRKMARRCKTGQFRDLVKQIRHEVPSFQITTDIIVGFPGETEQDWQNTLSFVEEIGFSHTHIFSYSHREGTKASLLPDPIDKATKKIRSQQLHSLAIKMKQQAFTQALDSSYEVLWEGVSKSKTDDQLSYMGYTPNYLRVQAHAPEGINLTNTITKFTPRAIASGQSHMIGTCD